MLKGVTVTLLERVDTGEVDAFNRSIYTEQPVDVANVLIAPVQSGGAEIVDTLNLDGRKADYKLAIQDGHPRLGWPAGPLLGPDLGGHRHPYAGH